MADSINDPTILAPVPPASSTARRCYLLELPKELRLEIYEYLLQPDGLDVASNDDSVIFKMSEKEAAAVRFEIQPIGKKLHPQILRSCRNIYDEASPILCHAEYLRLRPATPRTAPNERSVDLDVLRRCTKVTRVRLELVIGTPSADEDLAHSLLLASYLPPIHHHLKSLTIVLDDCLQRQASLRTRRHGAAQLMEMLARWSKTLQPSTTCVLHLRLAYDSIAQHSWNAGEEKVQWHDVECEGRSFLEAEEVERYYDLRDSMKKAWTMPMIGE